MKQVSKKLELPTKEQFASMVAVIGASGAAQAQDCADMVSLVISFLSQEWLILRPLQRQSSARKSLMRAACGKRNPARCLQAL